MTETSNPIEVEFDFAILQLEIGKAHCSVIYEQLNPLYNLEIFSWKIVKFLNK